MSYQQKRNVIKLGQPLGGRASAFAEKFIGGIQKLLADSGDGGGVTDLDLAGIVSSYDVYRVVIHIQSSSAVRVGYSTDGSPPTLPASVNSVGVGAVVKEANSFIEITDNVPISDVRFDSSDSSDSYAAVTIYGVLS